jgi:glycosyltransferase involved in cell wall biosynthesis
MSADRPDVSVVIPLRDEHDSLEELHRRLAAALQAMGRRAEYVFVDDGSVDGSFELLASLHARCPAVRVTRFRRSFGKAAALAEGFARAAGAIIVTIDADLQDEPEEVPRLIETLEQGGYDLVSGWKRVRHDPLSKRIPSRIFNRVSGALTGVKIHDMNCGLKAYRSEVVSEVRVYGGLYRFLPALAHWQGFKVGELQVRHHPRLHGRSKYGWRRLTDGFLDLLTVILTTRYTRRPLHFFGLAGLAVAAVGAVAATYILSLWIRFGNIQNHHPMLIFAVLAILLGVQLISTGLLAELIVSSRAVGAGDYSVKERLG